MNQETQELLEDVKKTELEVEQVKSKEPKKTAKELYKEFYGPSIEDGTIESRDGGNFYEMETSEFFRISRKLENHHSLFYKFWELGKPVFTRTLPTAAIMFNKDGRHINFLFNPEFWMSLDEYTREFIICHEMLHVVLNHGARIRDCTSREAANVALDIVVNHTLTNKFGFKREKLCNDWDTKGCWVDSIFPPEDGKPTYTDDRAFEFYYNKLPKMDIMNFILSKGGKGGQSMDDHSGLDDKQLEEIIKELDQNLSDEEKNELKDTIKKHFQENGPQEREGSVDGDKDPGKDTTQPDKNGGQEAGTTAGGLWHFCKVKKVKPKKKWESVIKNWVRKKLKEEFRDVDQWARPHRRHTLLTKSGLMLPVEMEVDDLYEDNNKIEVYFFLDTSGSCAGLADRFWKAAQSIPHGKNDKFELKLFCFDTRCYALQNDPKKEDYGVLKGFGGTSFDCIEKYVTERIKELKIKEYPTLFIITDGMGDTIEHQEKSQMSRWHWFLSTDYDALIPKDSHKYLLKNYE